VPVVEDLDVFKGLATSEGACLESTVSYELFLENCDKAPDHRVVPAIPLSAHALSYLVTGKAVAKSVTGVFRAPVAVEDDAWGRSTRTHRGV
jgi:hypothetical protein